jgi:Ribbon-helix-helix protein, copG family
MVRSDRQHGNTEETPVRTVTIKLPDSLALRLKQAVARRRATQSEVIREALEAHLAAPSVGSYLELVGDLAGSLRGAAPDLSSSKRRLRGFGR